ncbi:MAG: hypothetical protein LJE67_11880 [Salaquimonas sp.]|nr:hypothetical protein [Salaquimonas sp.]
MKSELCIFDVPSATVMTVWRTGMLIEAPNWSRDGKFMIFNGEGLIWRLELVEDAEPEQVDTGFAVNCNNDHGISPDGKTLVISDKTEAGASCIYTLPLDGGMPKRVTANVPSYWHGWSPDGETLVYAGQRPQSGQQEAVFDIYAMPVTGGKETRLTDGGRYHDGPDYTPDGEWIWFNSDRGGTMDLWRMRPDGGAKQQMTHDERVNWFPHPSPDGGRIVYLAYEEGVDGHPRDHEVELRMMDADGANVTTLIALFGGQGSINVPSWSPDSRRFAFMRYARQA